MVFFLNTNTFHSHVSCELVRAASFASEQIPVAHPLVYVFVSNLVVDTGRLHQQ